MKKFVKCRKTLNNEEAIRRITNLQQALTVNQDNLHYWENKKELSHIDNFILGVDKLTKEEFIQESKDEIDDYKRFLTVKYKWFIF
jgi:hypothetical protein